MKLKILNKILKINEIAHEIRVPLFGRNSDIFVIPKMQITIIGAINVITNNQYQTKITQFHIFQVQILYHETLFQVNRDIWKFKS